MPDFVTFIICDKCGKKYSSISRRCPNCGASRHILSPATVVLRILTGILAVLFGVFMILEKNDIRPVFSHGILSFLLTAVSFVLLIFFIIKSARGSYIASAEVFIFPLIAYAFRLLSSSAVSVTLLFITAAGLVLTELANTVLSAVEKNRDRERAFEDTERLSGSADRDPY